MRISIKGKTFMHGIALNELTGLFTPSEKYLSDGSWLLMDRETKADDNAEHFYRYMMQNHPEQTCYFVLNKTAPDWNRLEQEGFKLVEFGGSEYKRRLRKAEKLFPAIWKNTLTIILVIYTNTAKNSSSFNMESPKTTFLHGSILKLIYIVLLLPPPLNIKQS